MRQLVEVAWRGLAKHGEESGDVIHYRVVIDGGQHSQRCAPGEPTHDCPQRRQGRDDHQRRERLVAQRPALPPHGGRRRGRRRHTAARGGLSCCGFRHDGQNVAGGAVPRTAGGRRRPRGKALRHPEATARGRWGIGGGAFASIAPRSAADQGAKRDLCFKWRHGCRAGRGDSACYDAWSGRPSSQCVPLVRLSGPRARSSRCRPVRRFSGARAVAPHAALRAGRVAWVIASLTLLAENNPCDANPRRPVRRRARAV